MQVLEAGIADILILCDLLGYLFAQEEEFKPNKNLQRAGLQKIIENKDIGVVLILKNQDKVIGMASLLFTVSTALGGMVAWLEDMVVTPAARGKGYGSRLLQSAINYAHKRNCKRITLLTDSTNAGAQKFYTRHGFVNSSMLPMRYAASDNNA